MEATQTQHKPTLQDVFNKAWDTFVIRNLPPCRTLKKLGVVCLYRPTAETPHLPADHPGCIIGASIPDDILAAAFRELKDNAPEALGDGPEDIGPIADAIDQSNTLSGFFSCCDPEALDDLQSLHDKWRNNSPQADKQQDLYEFSVKYGLVVPIKEQS